MNEEYVPHDIDAVKKAIAEIEAEQVRLSGDPIAHANPEWAKAEMSRLDGIEKLLRDRLEIISGSRFPKAG